MSKVAKLNICDSQIIKNEMLIKIKFLKFENLKVSELYNYKYK